MEHGLNLSNSHSFRRLLPLSDDLATVKESPDKLAVMDGTGMIWIEMTGFLENNGKKIRKTGK
jgi:hypothetical protein